MTCHLLIPNEKQQKMLQNKKKGLTKCDGDEGLVLYVDYLFRS